MEENTKANYTGKNGSLLKMKNQVKIYVLTLEYNFLYYFLLLILVSNFIIEMELSRYSYHVRFSRDVT